MTLNDTPLMRDAAHAAVTNAVASGALTRPPECSRCGEPDHKDRAGRSTIHGHHHDYAKKLSVEWICVRCHRMEHSEESRRGQIVRHARAAGRPVLLDDILRAPIEEDENGLRVEADEAYAFARAWFLSEQEEERSANHIVVSSARETLQRGLHDPPQPTAETLARERAEFQARHRVRRERAKAEAKALPRVRPVRAETRAGKRTTVKTVSGFPVRVYASLFEVTVTAAYKRSVDSPLQTPDDWASMSAYFGDAHA